MSFAGKGVLVATALLALGTGCRHSTASSRDGGPDDTSAADVPDANLDVDSRGDLAGETAPAGSLTAFSVVVRPSGNLIVAGGLSGTVDLGLGPMTSAGDYDIFIAELQPSGAAVWNRRFGDADKQAYAEVALDAAGDLFVGASFHGTLDLGGGPLVSVGDSDLAVAKLDPSGNHVWSKRFGDRESETPIGLVPDGAGGVAVAFRFGSDRPNEGTSIVRLTSAGESVWTKTWPLVEAASFTASAAGGTLLAGSFWDSVDLGGGPLHSAGLEDIFIVELGSSGDWVWNERFGSYDDDQATGLAVSSAGDLLLVGQFDGELDFGGTAPLVSLRAPNRFAPSYDLFVAKLDARGAPLWSRQFGDALFDQGARSVTAAAAGGALVIGSSGGPIDLGLGPLVKTGGGSFLAGFDGDGRALWNDALPIQGGFAVLSTPAGHVLVTGSFAKDADLAPAVRTFVGGDSIFLVEYAP